MSFTAFGIGQALLAHAHAGASLSQPGVLRATIGGGLYLTVVGLLGFGFGALVRHTAGALSAFFGVLFALTASPTCSRPTCATRSSTIFPPTPAARSSPSSTRHEPSHPGPGSACSSCTPSPPRSSDDPDHPPRQLSRIQSAHTCRSFTFGGVVAQRPSPAAEWRPGSRGLL